MRSITRVMALAFFGAFSSAGCGGSGGDAAAPAVTAVATVASTSVYTVEPSASAPETTFYGRPLVEGLDELMGQDGPGDAARRGVFPAEGGKRWVRVTFPDTEAWEAKALFIQASYFQLLLPDGTQLWPRAITTDFCNSPAHRTAKQALHLAVGYGGNPFTPAKDYPLGVAFEVSSSEHKGLLRVSDQSLEVTW